MDSYTITITPNDDSGNSTTLVVDTAGDQVRITDVHLHAAGGLTGGEMPSVDFGFLLRAVAGSAGSPAAVTSAPPAPVPVGAGTSASVAVVDEPVAEATTPVPTVPVPTATAAPHDGEVDATPTPTPAPARKRSGPRRAAATRTAPSPAAAAAGQAVDDQAATAPRKVTVPRKAAARRKAAAGKRTPGVKPDQESGAGSAAAPASGRERVYRRMPEDFAEVYGQVGTTAGIVDHYAVPRYTAQGWVQRFKATKEA